MIDLGDFMGNCCFVEVRSMFSHEYGTFSEYIWFWKCVIRRYLLVSQIFYSKVEVFFTMYVGFYLFYCILCWIFYVFSCMRGGTPLGVLFYHFFQVYISFLVYGVWSGYDSSLSMYFFLFFGIFNRGLYFSMLGMYKYMLSFTMQGINYMIRYLNIK